MLAVGLRHGLFGRTIPMDMGQPPVGIAAARILQTGKVFQPPQNPGNGSKGGVSQIVKRGKQCHKPLQFRDNRHYLGDLGIAA
ncbi:MAG TPA: hypothetical protein VLV49_10205 [Terriglobales bacterium]|nr:hypothetical protein [Terriglobales bacterium]